MAQVDELEVFNAGLGAGLHHGRKYAWIAWNEETGEVPDDYVECVGIWEHETKRSRAGCHAECFERMPEGDGDGGHCIEGLGDTQLKDYRHPKFWMPLPKPGDY